MNYKVMKAVAGLCTVFALYKYEVLLFGSE